MIKTQEYTLNGQSFTRTWSTSGKVKRDGIIYDEAHDQTEYGRQYEEVTDESDVTPDEIVEALEGIL